MVRVELRVSVVVTVTGTGLSSYQLDDQTPLVGGLRTMSSSYKMWLW